MSNVNSIEKHSFDRETFEDELDKVKVIVVQALIRDGIIDKDVDVVDTWCANNFVVVKKATIARTLSNLYSRVFNKQKKESLAYYCMVKFKEDVYDRHLMEEEGVPFRIVNGGREMDSKGGDK